MSDDQFLFEIEPNNLTDEQLWALVRNQSFMLPDNRLTELIENGKQRGISAAEAYETEYLITLVDRAMLLRSQALVILKMRGYEQELISLLNPK